MTETRLGIPASMCEGTPPVNHRAGFILKEFTLKGIQPCHSTAILAFLGFLGFLKLFFYFFSSFIRQQIVGVAHPSSR
jgi:hypothetical protein